MKILVTGGTGVIGAAALPELLRRGHEVRLLSRSAEKNAEAYPAGVEAFPADITDEAAVRPAAAGCDGVLHIAGIVEEEPPEVTFARVNVHGTRNALAAARQAGLPLFVFVSSLGADTGGSEYHKSKYKAEELVRDYAGPWIILRPGSVYGPGDETVSLVLRMNRALPAVPVVAEGDQPFQPLWFEDFGRVIAEALARPELARNTYDVAGPEVTTTQDLLDRVEAITGRKPPRLAVPVWLAEFGALAMEAFGATGGKLLQQTGLGMPINRAKLAMLTEGNVVPPERQNALTTVFGVQPTPLQAGLEQLADMLPEQVPGQGVGSVERTTYFAEIRGTTYSPSGFIDLVCARLSELMPIEFAAEPGVPTRTDTGTTMTGAIPGRGNIQIRQEERTPECVTFVTIQGHPLAGVLQFEAVAIEGGVRFMVHVCSQPANVLDWVAMRTLGGMMQAQNWREVVRRVVKLSGGEAPDGVKRESRVLTEPEVKVLREWAEDLVQSRLRHAREAETTPVSHHR